MVACRPLKRILHVGEPGGDPPGPWIGTNAAWKRLGTEPFDVVVVDFAAAGTRDFVVGLRLAGLTPAPLVVGIGAASDVCDVVVSRPPPRPVTGSGEEAIRDDLGIYSTAFLAELLALEITRAAREHRPLTVAVVDPVGLQRINDRYGHAVGDRILVELDALLRGELRGGDVGGRHLGDALAVILPETPLDAAVRAMTRVRDVVRSGPVRAEGVPRIALAARIGLASFETGDDAQSLLARAAAALAGPDEVGVAPAAGVTGAREAPPQLAPGQVIGNAYRILHLIGEGGVGRVYRAEDITLERPVALKMLRPELAADPEFLTRFRSEATLLAAIQHPNLVQVFRFGETPDGTYFAMELVEGETLGDAIARAGKKGVYLPTPRLLACLGQIGSALDRLHQGGVLHRDVKPDNIALDPFRDRAVLLDVGVARQLGRAGEAAGTPGFVAPEVLFQLAESPASDVFSLAITAYQALTYRSPWASFDADPRQILARSSERPRPISSLRPELGAADEIFARGLSYDPRARPGSAGGLVEELFSALGPVGDEPPTRPSRPSGRMFAISPPPSGPPIVISGRENTVVDFHDAGTGPEAHAQTRGVVFRALARVLGGEYPRWLAQLTAGKASLGDALSPDRAGLAWSDAALFFDLLDGLETLAPDPEELARRFGRAALRSSFQRFFPASASTLSPDRIAGSLPVVWGKYHTWGRPTAVVTGPRATVTIAEIPRYTHTVGCWVEGLIGQTVTLCGGEGVVTELGDFGGGRLIVDVRWKGGR